MRTRTTALLGALASGVMPLGSACGATAESADASVVGDHDPVTGLRMIPPGILTELGLT